MKTNLFEEIQSRKSQLMNMAQKAFEYGWIDETRKNEIVEKIHNDILSIGIIGQMKAGKSTFLNSFVFEDDVLPAATTPMTASLSVITYGPEKKIVAEFYTSEEWEEQKLQATRSLDDARGNNLEESKIKAAKELAEKSKKLHNIESYFGKVQEDSFENLVEYVGADGKYVSITKSVKVFYPKEYLQGVEVVDTPGFNDPIVSREERTKDFLRKADVVLLMLYAGRPFDATDRDILFKNVRQCGIGKVILGINKYDMPYEKGETEEEIKNYVKSEVDRASRSCDDNSLVDILKEVEPIPFSAEMALLSKLPMSRISAEETYNYCWKRYCEIFEISSQKDLYGKSHIETLSEAVKNVIEKEKIEILLAKPTNAIMAAGNRKLLDIDAEVRNKELLIANLQVPDDELDERLEHLHKANRRLLKKMESLGDDLDMVFKDIIRKGKNEMEDNIDNTCRELDSIIDSLGITKSPDTIVPKLEAKMQTLISRTLKRNVENLAFESRSKIKRAVSDFIGEAEDVLVRHFPEFDTRSFVKQVENSIYLEIDDKEVFSYSASNEDEEADFFDVLGAVLDGFTLGLAGLLDNVFNHNSIVTEMHDSVNELRSSINPEKYLDTIYSRKEEIINYVKNSFITELIDPLQQQIEEVKLNRDNRENQLMEAQESLAKLLAEKSVALQQIESMKVK